MILRCIFEALLASLLLLVPSIGELAMAEVGRLKSREGRRRGVCFMGTQSRKPGLNAAGRAAQLEQLPGSVLLPGLKRVVVPNNSNW